MCVPSFPSGHPPPMVCPPSGEAWETMEIHCLASGIRWESLEECEVDSEDQSDPQTDKVNSSATCMPQKA